HGAGYYPSMDRALRRQIGPAETPRAFRPPTVFVLWSLLPGDRWIWLLLVALVGATGWVLLGLTDAPWAVPLIALYLLYNASPHLSAHGAESPLLGTGRAPFSVARWMGFGLPAGPVVGPILWGLAVWRLTHHRVFGDLMLPFMAMPVLGVLITRDYWGALLVP